MRSLHSEYKLRRVINARGTFTPLGVSRTPEPVIEATAEALRHFVDMNELSDWAGREIAGMTGAEWGAVTHCTAASITLSCAALMSGGDARQITRLPDSTGMNSLIVIQAGHLVNYGQHIEQAIRLSGAQVLVAGSDDVCTRDDLRRTLTRDGVAGLMLVESRLCRGNMVSSNEAIEIARNNEIPVVIDAAAQDLQLARILEFGADINLFSPQKYLSSPTAGLVIGKRGWVKAVHAQERGIGRGMKAGKEAIVGAVAALRYRADENMEDWVAGQREKAGLFVDQLNTLSFVNAELVEDPVGNPFSRVRAWIDQAGSGKSARQIEQLLAGGDPMISVQDHADADRALMFEIVALTTGELAEIHSQLDAVLEA